MSTYFFTEVPGLIPYHANSRALCSGVGAGSFYDVTNFWGLTATTSARCGT